MTDGSLIFDTKIKDEGFNSGISRLAGAAKKGMAVVGTALTAAGAYAIKVGSDFEAGMSEVAAISGATGKDLQALEEKAKQMGATTKFSATEAAEAMKYMAMAGWKSSDMIDGIAGVMNLAAASGENLAMTSDIVTDALTAFGLQAKDSTHFADVLAQTSSNANTNVSLMGETFKYVAPLAGSLGFSIEDTSLAIGLMANAGIKGSQAGTALRSTLTRMVKPTDDVSAAMNELGIEVTNSDGTMKSLNEIMKDCRSAFSKLSDAEKAQMASTIAGQEAMSGFLAIVNASDTDFAKLEAAINNADGAAEKMANTMNDNLKGKITILGSALEACGIEAYEKFEEPMKKAVDRVTDSVSKLSRDLSSGKLSRSLEKVADAAGEVASFFLDVAVDAIPVLIDGLAYVVDNFDKVSAIATVCFAAFKLNSPAFKTAGTMFSNFSSALKAGQSPMNAAITMIGNMGGKSAAFANAAMAAGGGAKGFAAGLGTLLNPMTLLVAGLAGATVGMTLWIKKLNDEALASDETYQRTKSLQESYEDLTESLNDNRQAREENLESAKTEGQQAENLLATIEQLEGVENKSAGQKAMMAEAVRQLNELVPELNLSYDEQTDTLSKNTGEIRRSIDAMQDLALQQAYQKNAEGIAQDLAKAQMEYTDALKVVEQNQQAVNDAIDKTAEAKARYDKSGLDQDKKDWDSAVLAQNRAQQALKSSQDTARGLRDEVDGLEDDFYDASFAAQNLANKANFDKLAEEAKKAGVEIPQSLKAGIESGAYAVPSSIDELTALIEYDKIVQKAKEAGVEVPATIANGISNGKMAPAEASKKLTKYIDDALRMDKEAKEAGEKVPDKMSEGIESNKKKVGKASKAVKDEAAKNLKDTGDQAGKEGSKQGTSYAENLDKTKGKAKTSGTNVKNSGTDGLKDTTNKAGSEGNRQGSNYSTSLDGTKGKAKNSGINVKNSGTDGLKDTTNKAGSEGTRTGTSYSTSLDNTKGSAKTSGTNVKNSGTDGLKDTTNKAGKEGSGQGGNFANALSGKQNAAHTAGYNVGQSGRSGISSGAGSAYQLGADFGQGYVNGIASKANAAVNAAASLVQNAIASIKNTQKSSSPSKITRSLGHDFGDGYALGMTDEESLVTESARDLTEAAVDQLTYNGFRFSQSALATSLSNLRDAARNTGALFEESAGANVKTGPGHAATAGSITNYTINQTFNGTGTPDPVTAAREMRNTVRRMEWEK